MATKPTKKISLPRMKEKYIKEAVPEMRKEFGYKNDLAAPTIERVVVNVGVGRILSNDSNRLDKITEDISLITGQKPMITKARQSIAGFKLREGMPVGISVTLRKNRMYEFLDRLVSVALPRVRDFRGLPAKSFDGQGNFSIGLKEQIVFPEVNREDMRDFFGLEVNIVTSAKNDKEGFKLLKLLGFPVKEED